jgi:hypothetical protein
MQHLQKRGGRVSNLLGLSTNARSVLVAGSPILRQSATILLAGELGDRWLRHRKMAEREESPDTVVVGSQEPVTK